MKLSLSRVKPSLPKELKDFYEGIRDGRITTTSIRRELASTKTYITVGFFSALVTCQAAALFYVKPKISQFKKALMSTMISGSAGFSTNAFIILGLELGEALLNIAFAWLTHELITRSAHDINKKFYEEYFESNSKLLEVRIRAADSQSSSYRNNNNAVVQSVVESHLRHLTYHGNNLAFDNKVGTAKIVSGLATIGFCIFDLTSSLHSYSKMNQTAIGAIVFVVISISIAAGFYFVNEPANQNKSEIEKDEAGGIKKEIKRIFTIQPVENEVTPVNTLKRAPHSELSLPSISPTSTRSSRLGSEFSESSYGSFPPPINRDDLLMLAHRSTQRRLKRDIMANNARELFGNIVWATFETISKTLLLYSGTTGMLQYRVTSASLNSSAKRTTAALKELNHGIEHKSRERETEKDVEKIRNSAAKDSETLAAVSTGGPLQTIQETNEDSSTKSTPIHNGQNIGNPNIPPLAIAPPRPEAQAIHIMRVNNFAGPDQSTAAFLQGLARSGRQIVGPGGVLLTHATPLPDTQDADTQRLLQAPRQSLALQPAFTAHKTPKKGQPKPKDSPQSKPKTTPNSELKMDFRWYFTEFFKSFGVTYSDYATNIKNLLLKGVPIPSPVFSPRALLSKVKADPRLTQKNNQYRYLIWHDILFPNTNQYIAGLLCTYTGLAMFKLIIIRLLKQQASKFLGDGIMSNYLMLAGFVIISELVDSLFYHFVVLQQNNDKILSLSDKLNAVIHEIYFEDFKGKQHFINSLNSDETHPISEQDLKNQRRIISLLTQDGSDIAQYHIEGFSKGLSATCTFFPSLYFLGTTLKNVTARTYAPIILGILVYLAVVASIDYGIFNKKIAKDKKELKAARSKLEHEISHTFKSKKSKLSPRDRAISSASLSTLVPSPSNAITALTIARSASAPQMFTLADDAKNPHIEGAKVQPPQDNYQSLLTVSDEVCNLQTKQEYTMYVWRDEFFNVMNSIGNFMISITANLSSSVSRLAFESTYFSLAQMVKDIGKGIQGFTTSYNNISRINPAIDTIAEDCEAAGKHMTLPAPSPNPAHPRSRTPTIGLTAFESGAIRLRSGTPYAFTPISSRTQDNPGTHAQVVLAHLNVQAAALAPQARAR
jgi:hypothetical protein